MKAINFKTCISFFILTLAISNLQAQDQEPTDMLFQHVLFFKWVDTIDETKKEEILNLFKGLPEKVEGFEKISINDIAESSGEYNLILSLEFTSEEAVKVYEKHPDHVKISKMGPELLSGFGFVDYWK